MKRRGFVKLCAAAVAGITSAPELLASGHQQYHRYGRVALVNPQTSAPVGAGALEVGETYVFHYPFVSTPCFLIDLGKSVKARNKLQTREGKPYVWRGGAGPRSSVVAFSAICAHKMSHPARSVSFINYRHGETRFRNSDDQIEERPGVIYCCSENSVYDPARGGQVLGGPAPQPLAAIELDYDAGRDMFYATATIGGEMFDRYFKDFHDRLVLEHGRTDIDRAMQGSSELMRLTDFTSNPVSCQA
jgi:Rieske Fe-S protein